MTKDAWISLLVKILLMVLTPLAAQMHINDGATLTAFSTDIADAIVLMYGMYAQWNMKRVKKDAVVVQTPTPSPVIGATVTGKVVSVLLAAFAISLLFPHASRASDVAAPTFPIKTPAFSLSAYPYESSGFYAGLFTEGGGGSVNTGSIPGIGAASLSTTSAGAGVTVGYAWGKKGTNVAASCEADFGWTNFNGNTAGLSLSGPMALEQNCVVFTPLANIQSMLPSFPSLGTVAPFPTLQPGVTASNLQMGLLAGIRENDISLNFAGLSPNHEWRIAPEIGLVAMQQLSNGTAMRAWVKTVFPDKGVCAGPIKNACANYGQQVLAGVGVYF